MRSGAAPSGWRAGRRKLTWLLLLLAPCAHAASLTGTVMNRTTNQPAATDVVALIGFGSAGMQAVATATTDSAGKYALPVPDSGTHLVRVTHQRATYFKPVQDDTRPTDVDVYDVAVQVDGIATEADVLSVQAAPGGDLQVREDFFVRNSSAPPRTQLSDRAYEFFLPEGAHLEGAAAMGPGGAPVDATPAPLPGPGHYAFVFPVRPGQTRFQATYTLPYSGHKLPWVAREALPTENLIVLLPKSMRFAPDDTEWQSVAANAGAQVWVRKGVAALAPTRFAVSGEGQLPRDTPVGGPEPDAAKSEAPRPGGGLGAPEATPDPLGRAKGWLLGGLGLLLGGGALLLLRRAPHGLPAPPPASLRVALGEAMAALERERAAGSLAPGEYAATRALLEEALHRALERDATEALR